MAGRAGAAGRVVTKRAPPVDVAVARIVASCAVAMRRAMASPRPLPPSRLGWAPGRLANGSKTRSRWSKRDAGTGVADGELDGPRSRRHGHRHLAARRGVVKTVIDEDEQQLHEAIAVAEHERGGRRLDDHPHLPLGRQGLRAAGRQAHDLRQVDRPPLDDERDTVSRGQGQQVPHQPTKALGLGDDVFRQRSPLGRDEGLALEDLGVRADEGGGGPQLVRSLGDESTLRLE